MASVGFWPLWKDFHKAESLLPGGRGEVALADETVLPRVRWAKDPVELNRRHSGGVLWVLNRWRVSQTIGHNDFMPALRGPQGGSKATKLWPK